MRLDVLTKSTSLSRSTLRNALPVLAVGLVFAAMHLWVTALAPVVRWSDSNVDLDWASRGEGFLYPPSRGTLVGDATAHTPKPGYLAFLRLCLAVFPSDPTKGVVLLQSAILSLSFVGTAGFMSIRWGRGAGLGLIAVLFMELRFRDMTSSVMPEALASALLLPLAVAILADLKSWAQMSGWGVACGVLFLVRPNLGVIAWGLLAASCWVRGRMQVLAVSTAALAVLVVPFIVVAGQTRPGGQGRLSFSILEGSADDLWTAGLKRGDLSGNTQELAIARRNWARLLRSRGPDTRRQLVWRALHGVIGGDFYDPRWSREYQRADVASRVAWPFAIAAAIGVLIGRLISRTDDLAAILGLLLVSCLIAQSLLIGSLPRYALPALPAVLLLALRAAFRGERTRLRWRLVGSAGGSTAVLLAIIAYPSVASWEWGKIERGGVRIVQRIARGSLPMSNPATLHIRVAPAGIPSGTRVQVYGPDGALLRCVSHPEGTVATVDIELPEAVRMANQSRPIELSVVSAGTFAPEDFLLFPVVPPPWRMTARRLASADLSPETGIMIGSLDWWAHPGTP